MNQFIGLTLISSAFWTLGRPKLLLRSTLHALSVVFLAHVAKVPEEYTAAVSAGYFIADLPDVTGKLYLFHHLLGIWFIWLGVHPPLNKYNILTKLMVVEYSTPWLNYFLTKKTSRNCLVYLAAHVLCRNILLTKIYFKYLPLLREDGIPNTQVGAFGVFLAMNYWWTWRTWLSYKRLRLKGL